MCCTIRISLLPIKILSGHNQSDQVDNNNNGIIYQLKDGERPQDYDDCAIVTNDNYIKIFKKYLKKSPKKRRILSIVKLKNINNDFVVYRRLILRNAGGNRNDYIAITTKTWSLLSDDYVFSEEKDIEVSKGCKFLYYWNHPFHATRISMRLGVVGIIVSIFFGICSALFSLL